MQTPRSLWILIFVFLIPVLMGQLIDYTTHYSLKKLAIIPYRNNESLEKLTKELDVPYFGTPTPVIDKMLEMAKITPQDLVYDLGCGDGRILIAAAKKYGARGIGVEIDPEKVKEARDNVVKAGVEKLVTIRQGDILHIDFSDATVLALYLSPPLLKHLTPQFKRLKDGARIVSHDYSILHYDANQMTKIYLTKDKTEKYWDYKKLEKIIIEHTKCVRAANSFYNNCSKITPSDFAYYDELLKIYRPRLVYLYKLPLTQNDQR